jgi:hypothetical protein
MGVDRIDEAGDRASEEQGCLGVWGRFYIGVSGKKRMQRWDERFGNKVSSDKELKEVEWIPEGD